MKNLIPILILISLLAFIIVGIYYSRKQSKVENKATAIATLRENLIAASHNDARFEFMVDSVLHTYYDVKRASRVVGDKFVIEYNTENPENAKLINHKPIFIDGEHIHVTHGEIIKFMKIGAPSLEFRYSFRGKKYKRWQYLDPEYKSLYPPIKKGATYEIAVWDKNPQRSIMNFEKKID